MRKETLASFACLVTLCIPVCFGQSAKYYQGVQWRSLFNGEDLTGWKNVGHERWTVEDGAILGESLAGGDGFIVTEEEFSSFELHVRFKADTLGNSGVFYHMTYEGDEFGNGMQVEVDPAVNRHTAGLHEPRGRGWVVWPAPENETVIKPYEWNDLLITVKGNRVTTRLNGVQMIDFTDPKPKNSRGVIGFQLHPGKGGQRIRFKDIWIRPLDE
jgi:hypothetical protein